MMKRGMDVYSRGKAAVMGDGVILLGCWWGSAGLREVLHRD